MKEVYIGSIIRKRRQELGLTQEQLCRGICETVTLSRIENGKQTPRPAASSMHCCNDWGCPGNGIMRCSVSRR